MYIFFSEIKCVKDNELMSEDPKFSTQMCSLYLQETENIGICQMYRYNEIQYTLINPEQAK